MARISVYPVIAVLLLACATLICTIVSERLRHSSFETTTLESAILPPEQFRQWWIGQSRELFNDQGRNTVPGDRFAGRNDWTRPTVVPGYLEKEQNETRTTYMPKVLKLKQDLLHIKSDLQNRSKAAEWPQLQKQEKDDMEQLKNTYYEWFSTDAQKKAADINKDLVIGRARQWNNDAYLGGSDHFVSASQAQAQLDGGGYGHRFELDKMDLYQKSNVMRKAWPPFCFWTFRHRIMKLRFLHKRTCIPISTAPYRID